MRQVDAEIVLWSQVTPPIALHALCPLICIKTVCILFGCPVKSGREF